MWWCCMTLIPELLGAGEKAVVESTVLVDDLSLFISTHVE